MKNARGGGGLFFPANLDGKEKEVKRGKNTRQGEKKRLVKRERETLIEEKC